MKRILRRPQLLGTFVAGDPMSGYYNDMTGVVGPDPALAADRLAALTKDRRLANPVSIAQHGLGAWQHRLEGGNRLEIAAAAGDWVCAEHDGDGLIRYGFGMPHTYDLRPGWASAMAQGEAASLRARQDLSRAPSICSTSAPARGAAIVSNSELISETPDCAAGAVPRLASLCTSSTGGPLALWGLSPTLGIATRDTRSDIAFEQGVETLAARLALDGTGGTGR